MVTVYEDHGIHAKRTYEEACEVARQCFQSGWIFENPNDGHEKGWHFIVLDFEHYCMHGYIPRAHVKVEQTINPCWTGGVVMFGKGGGA